MSSFVDHSHTARGQALRDLIALAQNQSDQLDKRARRRRFGRDGPSRR